MNCVISISILNTMVACNANHVSRDDKNTEIVYKIQTKRHILICHMLIEMSTEWGHGYRNAAGEISYLEWRINVYFIYKFSSF